MSSMPSRVLFAAPAALALVLFGVMVASYWGYTNDDAYITFRYSAALAEGRGPYFNPGEHVEGYTNFSWMILAAGLYRLVGAEAMPALARGVDLVAGAGAMLAGGRLALRLAGGGAPWAAALVSMGLVAVSPGFAINSVSGLETGLYALLVCAGVALAVEEAEGGPAHRAAAVLALAGLTRPEGVLLGALVWATLAGLRWRGVTPCPQGWARPVLAGALILGGTSAAHMALRLALYDGEWLPNTYFAKLGGFGGVTPVEYLWTGLRGPLLGLPGAALALAGLAPLLRARPTAAPAVAVALAGALLPLATGADWMPGSRLVMPYLPVITAVATLAWGGLAGRLGERGRALAPVVLLAAVPASALGQAAEGARLADEIALRARGYQTGHEAAAAWIRARSQPGDALSMMDVGIVGYRNLDRTVIDLSGLTDRFVARSPGLFLEKRYDPAYILDRAPKFMVLVFYAEGTPYSPPRAGGVWRPWTITEELIYSDPRFKARYLQPLPAQRTGTWVGGIAKGLGAAMAFEHGHPGVNYLLVVFERQDSAATAPTSG